VLPLERVREVEDAGLHGGRVEEEGGQGGVGACACLGGWVRCGRRCSGGRVLGGGPARWDELVVVMDVSRRQVW
jgi:hypothetical protein